MVDKVDLRKGNLLRHFYKTPLNEMCPEVKETIWTGWGVLHLILYFFIGFFCPKLFWLSVIVGFIWELVEYLSQDCHDLFDFINNIAGFGLGAAVRYCISKPL